jgi:hypothetical protein
MKYQRKFPSTLGEDEVIDGFLRPREYVDPDEDAVIERVRRDIVDGTLRLPKGAGKDDPSFHEPHWGHGTGLLRGTLEIDRIDALPERFRVGLFGRAQTYAVVCRPNFIHDKKAKLKAARMSVKLEYPDAVPNVYAPDGEAHELDLLFAEGAPETNGLGHAFFFRDARELAMFGTLAPPSLRTAATVLDVRNWGHIANVIKRLKEVLEYGTSPGSADVGWAGKSYYCAGPYALGDGAMKFCLEPRQKHPLGTDDGDAAEPASRQRAAMERWVAAGEDAVFDLCVQLGTTTAIPSPGPDDPPKGVMMAEYCDLQWDESKSPYIPVGTLTFHASADSDLSETFGWSPLQFNAWNTLESMRPLGQTFRARKQAHKAHAEARIEHVYDAEPGAMVDKAPFSDAAG